VRRTDSAFTLIEVLVALAIVSVVLLGALRAAGQGTASVEALRARTLAAWIAQDTLTEHRARGEWLALGTHRATIVQSGIEFTRREDVTPTPNAAFRRVDVSIYAARDESAALARITGFVVQPPRAAR
jgi:general secretion pathway protein I